MSLFKLTLRLACYNINQRVVNEWCMLSYPKKIEVDGKIYTLVEKKMLGEGSFGAVVKYHDQEKKAVAIKFLKNLKPISKETQEIVQACDPDHKFATIKINNGEKLAIEIMPFLGKLNLAQWKPQDNDLLQRLYWISQILLNLSWLHNPTASSPNVIRHGDLKPENTLKGNKKKEGFLLIDFDFAEFLPHNADKSIKTKNAKGSPDYMPPEYFSQPAEAQFSLADDIYALTALILKLLGAVDPLHKKMQPRKNKNRPDIEYFQAIANQQFNFKNLLNDNLMQDCPDEYKQRIKDSVIKLLNRMQGPQQARPNINDVMRFFTDLQQVVGLYTEIKEKELPNEIKQQMRSEISERLHRCDLICDNVYFHEAENMNFFVKTKPVDDKEQFCKNNEISEGKLKDNIYSSLEKRKDLNIKNEIYKETIENKALEKYAGLYEQALNHYNTIVTSENEENDKEKIALFDLLFNNAESFKAMQTLAPELKRPIDIWFNLSTNLSSEETINALIDSKKDETRCERSSATLSYYKTIMADLMRYIQKQEKKALLHLLKNCRYNFDFIVEELPILKPLIDSAKSIAVAFFKDEYKKDWKESHFTFFRPKSEINKKVHEETLTFEDILKSGGSRTAKIINGM